MCIRFHIDSLYNNRFGAGTKGPINMLSQYMIGSAASFGFFIGFYKIYLKK